MGGHLVIDWKLLGTILFALFWFGCAFNAFVDFLRDRSDGYLSMLVAVGVGITLIGVAIISWQAAVLVLVCFTASGIPMIIGEIARSISKREKALRIQRLIAEVEAKDIIDAQG
ncbi:hypothetical protein KA005_61045 [bacterium]|nr:hypothetical protein [bacterium]